MHSEQDSEGFQFLPSSYRQRRSENSELDTHLHTLMPDHHSSGKDQSLEQCTLALLHLTRTDQHRVSGNFPLPFAIQIHVFQDL